MQDTQAFVNVPNGRAVLRLPGGITRALRVFFEGGLYENKAVYDHITVNNFQSMVN